PIDVEDPENRVQVGVSLNESDLVGPLVSHDQCEDHQGECSSDVPKDGVDLLLVTKGKVPEVFEHGVGCCCWVQAPPSAGRASEALFPSRASHAHTDSIDIRLDL